MDQQQQAQQGQALEAGEVGQQPQQGQPQEAGADVQQPPEAGAGDQQGQQQQQQREIDAEMMLMDYQLLPDLIPPPQPKWVKSVNDDRFYPFASNFDVTPYPTRYKNAAISIIEGLLRIHLPTNLSNLFGRHPFQGRLAFPRQTSSNDHLSNLIDADEVRHRLGALRYFPASRPRHEFPTHLFPPHYPAVYDVPYWPGEDEEDEEDQELGAVGGRDDELPSINEEDRELLAATQSISVRLASCDELSAYTYHPQLDDDECDCDLKFYAPDVSNDLDECKTNAYWSSYVSPHDLTQKQSDGSPLITLATLEPCRDQFSDQIGQYIMAQQTRFPGLEQTDEYSDFAFGVQVAHGDLQIALHNREVEQDLKERILHETRIACKKREEERKREEVVSASLTDDKDEEDEGEEGGEKQAKNQKRESSTTPSEALKALSVTSDSTESCDVCSLCNACLVCDAGTCCREVKEGNGGGRPAAKPEYDEDFEGDLEEIPTRETSKPSVKPPFSLVKKEGKKLWMGPPIPNWSQVRCKLKHWQTHDV